MLHIVGLIFKILGLIVGGVLGLLLLILCVLLFVPVRYRIKGVYHNQLDTLKVEVKISWLLHLISGHISYDHPNIKWKMRELWLNQSSEESSKQSKRSTNKSNSNTNSKHVQERDDLTEEKTMVEGSAHKIETHQMDETHSQIEYTEKTKTEQFPVPKKKKNTKKIIGTFFEGLKKKTKSLFQKIKYTFKRFCDNIKLIVQKKEYIQEFLEKETHVYTFGKTKKALFRLLKHWRPKRCEIKGEVGFEDPYTTGRLLAGLSMVYPFIGEHIYITPNFEQQVLDGSFCLKGRIMMVHLVIMAIRLVVDSQVRQTIKDVKNFKL